MKRLSFPFLMLAAGCGGSTQPMGAPDAGRDPLEVLCDDVEARLAATAAPGWGIAIVEDGEVVILKAGGVADAREPDVGVTIETPFRTLALSELYTAIAALEIAAEGRIDLDAPVRDYLPSFDVQPAEWRDGLTVRHLLYQTGGLPSRIRAAPESFGETIEACEGRGDLSIDAWVEELGGMQMGAPPGRFQIRDIVSYVVLARVLVAVEGMSFAEIIRARVFEPAGMSGAYVGWRADSAVASGHEGFGVTAVAATADYLCEAHQPLNLAYAGIADIARLAQVLANGGVGPDGVAILAGTTVDAVLGGIDAASWISAELRAGAGLHPWPHEGGAVSTILSVGYGYGVGFAVSRERRFAAVVVRNESNSPYQEALAPILEARLGARIINRQYSPDPTSWSPDTETLAAIAGDYADVAGRELSVTLEDGALRVWLASTMQGGPLRPVLADRFNAAILGAAPIVRVYRDGAGEPEALWIQYVDHPFWRLPAGPPPPSAGGM